MTPINILIVDDREENIISLTALLERDDIKILSTTSPNDALKLVWENPISIALVDVQMPEMDGFEFVKMLKSNQRTKDILVIFVTAISKDAKYAIKGLEAGAVDYLYKPLDPYITVAKVDSFIQLARYQVSIKQKNEELQNYAAVVKNSSDIICAVDAESLRIETINPAVKKILGIDPDELIGKSVIDFVIDVQKPEFRIQLGEIIKDNIAGSVLELQFKTFGKRIIWVECRVSYQNRTMLLNINDISAQKSFQIQLIRSKENAEYSKKAKETFLANMSHELRTPVNGILGLTNLLRKTELTEQQSNMIGLLETSSQSLLGVINDVLDISKIEAGKFSIIRAPNNIHNLVKSVYGLLKFNADENNIGFSMEITPDVPVNIMVDSLRLNQILMNLLSNAIKFTEQGEVKLKVSVQEKEVSRVKLIFTVEDTGIGIPADRLSNIFDSFEQAEDDTAIKYGGTGLGLAIVKKLVELKGGEIVVSSEVGKGSTFTFTNWHALADAQQQNVKGKTVKTVAPFKNIRVLIAEDNLVNQFMLSKMLKDWQMEVEMVDNGSKAIDKLKLKDYDLILMDTNMPVMNGYQAAKAIRMDFEEPKRSIPIISLSAATLDYEREEALSSGMNDVLSKPFHPQELHSKISKLITNGELVKIPV